MHSALLGEIQRGFCANSGPTILLALLKQGYYPIRVRMREAGVECVCVVDKKMSCLSEL